MEPRLRSAGTTSGARTPLHCDFGRRGKGCAAAECPRAVRIIVTGGAGFIGSHIVDRYLELGHEVLVVDNLWSHGGGRRENVPARAAFAQVDIRDEELGHLFLKFKPDVVCHEAAQHSVAIGARDPKYDAQVNVLGLINVLEAAAKASARKVIYASSGAIFGTPDRLPIDERTPQMPESPYGITKMVGEHYLRFYKRERGLDFTALRYANVYGPRQDPNGEAGVIAIFAGRFLEVGRPNRLGRRADSRLRLRRRRGPLQRAGARPRIRRLLRNRDGNTHQREPALSRARRDFRVRGAGRTGGETAGRRARRAVRCGSREARAGLGSAGRAARRDAQDLRILQRPFGRERLARP